MARLQGKIAIITGAASGMGAATADLFAREGATVVLTDLDEVAGNATTKGLRDGGAAAFFEPHDTTVVDAWARVVDHVLAAHGRIDVLVNNAGVSGAHPDPLSLEAWDKQFAVHSRGHFLGLRAVAPIMQRQRKGSIVNVSSISGVIGQDYVHMGYSAAKGSILAMTRTAAVQFAAAGIRVNAVLPGIMPPMRTSTVTADPEIRRRLIQLIPLGRAGRVNEVANANLFLASDESSYVTGAELVVDGGFTAL